MAQTFLRDLIRPSDAARPVRGKRRAQLDRLMRRHVLIDGALRVSLVGAGNRITYSTDHRLIGKPAGDRADWPRCASGVILSRVTDVRATRGRGKVKALVSSVPISLGHGKVAVVSIEQDYAPIAAAARESLLPVAAVLELALILLFVLLLPALARASRRLRTLRRGDPLPGEARRAHRPAEPDRAAREPRRRAPTTARTTSTSRCC